MPTRKELSYYSQHELSRISTISSLLKVQLSHLVAPTGICFSLYAYEWKMRFWSHEWERVPLLNKTIKEKVESSFCIVNVIFIHLM
ncbi:unnamed protein product [Victoria cruziana]